jgi:Rhodopirellula transposase DDE domain
VTPIHGSTDPRFQVIRDAFAANFRDHGEVGAALCVYHRGRRVVDLWGGIADCHYPPGTSKWNKIEYKLFSRITLNWRDRPLETYQTIVNLITNTTTTTGLTIHCELDPNLYPIKIKLTDQQKESIPLSRHEFHGDWNYITEPQIQ